jgi:hypothetical protein
MKQGRLVRGCVNRRGSEKGRGWLTLAREDAFVEDVARGWQNLRRGAAALVRAGPSGPVVSAEPYLRVWFEGVSEGAKVSARFV